MIRRLIIATALATLVAIAAPAPAARQQAAPAPPAPQVILTPDQDTATSQIEAQGDGGGCASQGEWDRLEVFMSRSTVTDLFGTSGWFMSDNGEVIRKGYDLCWTNQRFGVVRYDSVSGLSVSWVIRDK